MAGYSTSNPPRLVAGSLENTVAPNIWLYGNGDSNATVIAANYVTNAQALGIKAGDMFINLVAATPELYLNIVTAVASTGTTMGSSPATCS